MKKIIILIGIIIFSILSVQAQVKYTYTSYVLYNDTLIGHYCDANKVMKDTISVDLLTNEVITTYGAIGNATVWGQIDTFGCAGKIPNIFKIGAQYCDSIGLWASDVDGDSIINFSAPETLFYNTFTIPPSRRARFIVTMDTVSMVGTDTGRVFLQLRLGLQ